CASLLYRLAGHGPRRRNQRRPVHRQHGMGRGACVRGVLTMEQQPQAYRFVWQGIEVEATYTPRKWSVIAHLAIRSIAQVRAPLPITGTGYSSHFHQPGTVEKHGGDVVAQVTAWLDEEATSPDWLTHVARSRQG